MRGWATLLVASLAIAGCGGGDGDQASIHTTWFIQFGTGSSAVPATCAEVGSASVLVSLDDLDDDRDPTDTFPCDDATGALIDLAAGRYAATAFLHDGDGVAIRQADLTAPSQVDVAADGREDIEFTFIFPP